MLKSLFSTFLVLLLATAASAATRWSAEAGVSWFMVRGFDLGTEPGPLAVRETDRAAPFVAGRYAFTDRFGVKLAYDYVANADATAEYGYPPGQGGDVHTPVAIWGRYDIDLHVVSLAPEFTWPVNARLSVTLAPAVNWVASRAWVAYDTTLPNVLLVAAHAENDDGFTLGANVGISWALSERAALTASYRYVDLNPSWHREAHVVSGGLRWTF